MDERRKFKRLQRDMPARHQKGDVDDVQQGKAADVSTGGLRLRSEVPMRPGATLTTEIIIPGTPRPFYAFSQVVWCKAVAGAAPPAYEIGIKFIRVVSKARVRGF